MSNILDWISQIIVTIVSVCVIVAAIWLVYTIIFTVPYVGLALGTLALIIWAFDRSDKTGNY